MSKDQIKIPLQLASLIQGEAGNLLGAIATAVPEDDVIGIAMDDGSSMPAAAAEATPTRPNAATNKRGLNAIVNAAQTRHVKELGSYIRAVCMRMGFADERGES